MATIETGYDVEADRATNTLYIELAGRMEPEEIEAAADEVLAAAEGLSEGFSVINDISEFMPPSPEAAKPIKRAQTELRELGVGDVVRVVADETSTVTENAPAGLRATSGCISRSAVNATSWAVTGTPSCHRTSVRRRTIQWR
jgi:hypothetical protein